MRISALWRPARIATAALAAAAVITLGAIVPAQANSVLLPDTLNPGGNPALIDASRTASLHIHKYEQPVELGTEGNGLEEDTTGLTPLAGIRFVAQPVTGIDLTTNEGWQEAGALTTEEAIARAGDEAASGETDVDGLVSFTDLPLGLYVVTEELTADQQAAGISGAAPFLVTLPLTHPTAQNEWLYDVHVYPKNGINVISKAVTDSDATRVGDQVTWTITSSIPAGGIAERYTITDQLDPRLGFLKAIVTMGDVNFTTFSADVDYVSTFVGNLLTIDFTPDGRAKIAEAKQQVASTTVQVQVNTVVETLGDNGIVLNQATLFPNNANTYGVPSNQVESRWGSIDIKKIEQGSGNALAGAEFQVFRSEEDARAGLNAITIKDEVSWTSNDNGLVRIEGLRASNWANGAELPEDEWKYYWVAEVTAPSGFELLADPIRVAVLDNTPDTIELTVENVPHNAGFHLPLTGAAGTWMFVAGGAAVLLIALGMTLRSRGRRTALAAQA